MSDTPEWCVRLRTVPIPEELEEARESLELWLEYKQERGESYTVAGWKALLSRLRKMGAERTIAAIEFSAGNGWQGIYEEKTQVVTKGKALMEAEVRRKYEQKLRLNLVQFKRVA